QDAPRQDADEAITVPTPVVTPTNATGGPVDETAVLPRVRDEDAARDTDRSAPADAEVTTELPRPQAPGAADETAVLPPVPPGAADETAVLPPVREGAPGPEGPDDRTRELPQIDAESAPRRRERPDWAEETPLDDLPSLADELLGPHEDDHGDDEGRDGGGRWRRR
ncbi:dTMP kinase, partial [Streptomyces sp. SID4956]|nr:dTMP kinase [Streptomyces sp. SID4956]